MDRRGFLGFLLSALLGAGSIVLTGCMAPLVSATARDKSAGDPWQCQNCGHLTRSREDLSETRCPRCTRKMLKKISEAEMAEALES